MRKIFFLCVFISTIAACKDEQKSGEGTLKVNEFINGFKQLKLPYSVSDSNINAINDTATLSYAAVIQLIPDTILNSLFGSDKNLTIHPIGKFENKGNETYFVTHVQSKNKSAVYLFVLDKNKKYAATLPLIVSNSNKDFSNSAAIDNKLAIAINKEWKNENELLYNRVIYAYNNVGVFTVVMTETNDQSHLSNKINNPLDTLPQLNKYSGDYTKGKKSFLFLRDGKNASSYLFYVRFENDADEVCTGELKGEIILKSETSAVFSEVGDPCLVDFIFSKNQVSVKEQGSCGNHRGIKCFFDDTYVKKKGSAPKR